ncbi:hypothetical protein GQ53DRAFT_823618 [Thozetella sp. PMI_491]|nr:hypothetical protein GQ53DRAFT_823618 [Thozetella sp. PMI_491]
MGLEEYAPNATLNRLEKALKGSEEVQFLYHKLAIHQRGPGAVPAGLLNSNVTGLISLNGNFTSSTASLEYLFIFSTVPSKFNGNVTFFKGDVVRYMSGCPEIAVSAYFYTGTVEPATVEFTRNQTTVVSQSNNVIYHNIYVILTALRPEAHSPHFGPIGGSPPNNWNAATSTTG